MVDFEKLLTESLGRTNDGYLRAMNDLRELTVRASEALERLSQDRLRLSLREDDARENGTRCDVILVRTAPLPPDTRTVLRLVVPSTGYPIMPVNSSQEQDWEPIEDGAALEQSLATLFSDPQSPVVLTLAWLRRQDLQPTGS